MQFNCRLRPLAKQPTAKRENNINFTVAVCVCACGLDCATFYKRTAHTHTHTHTEIMMLILMVMNIGKIRHSLLIIYMTCTPRDPHGCACARVHAPVFVSALLHVFCSVVLCSRVAWMCR